MPKSFAGTLERLDEFERGLASRLRVAPISPTMAANDAWPSKTGNGLDDSNLS